MNRLPEKLTALRKQFGYAQGDLAQRLQVPVNEYMNWENGNAICNVQQLVALAEIYHITVDDLVDNTKNIVFKEPAVNNVNIPYLPDMTSVTEDQEATVQMTAVQSANTERITDTISFEATRVNEIVDTTAIDTQRAEEEEAERKAAARRRRLAEKRRQQEEQKKKKTYIIAGIVAAIAVVAAILLLVFGRSSSKEINSLSSVNRLALGDTYSLFIDRNGRLEEKGSFHPKESFDGVVQVSAYDDHALGLKKDGTVVSSNADHEVDQWEDITMIAAGANHSVGLKSDGTVVCTGDDNACEVSAWKDITAVYAGNAVTVGIKKDGTIESCGNIDPSAANQSDVASVAFGKGSVIIVKKDGTALAYGSEINTTAWTNIDSAACGNNIAIGLKSDHTLACSIADEEMQKKVSKWSNIRYIAASGNTIIAINGNEKMYGAGDNSYGQYVETAKGEEDEEAEKLSVPKNIQVSATTVNVVIKWDSVEHADYYEVTVDTDPETKAKVDNNQTSIAVSALEDDKEYTITVVAHSDDDKKYAESEAAKYKYQYKSVSEKLGPVSNIHGEMGNGYTWVLLWDEVEHADYYIVTLDGGAEQTTLTNKITIALEGTNVSDGSTHNISVKACSESSAYKEGDASKTQLTYTKQKVEYDVIFVFRVNGEEVPDSRKSVTIIEGKYDITPYMPAGYILENPEANIFEIPNQMNEGFINIGVQPLKTDGSDGQ